MFFQVSKKQETVSERIHKELVLRAFLSRTSLDQFAELIISRKKRQKKLSLDLQKNIDPSYSCIRVIPER